MHIAAHGAVTVFGNIVLMGQAPAQAPARSPNNSTPGTATANTGQPAVYKVDRHQITLKPKEGIDVTVTISASGFFSRAFTLSRAGRVPRELPDGDAAPAR